MTGFDYAMTLLKSLNAARVENRSLKQENLNLRSANVGLKTQNTRLVEMLRRNEVTPHQAGTRNPYDAGDTTAIDRFRAASPLSRL